MNLLLEYSKEWDPLQRNEQLFWAQLPQFGCSWAGGLMWLTILIFASDDHRFVSNRRGGKGSHKDHWYYYFISLIGSIAFRLQHQM